MNYGEKERKKRVDLDGHAPLVSVVLTGRVSTSAPTSTGSGPVCGSSLTPVGRLDTTLRFVVDAQSSCLMLFVRTSGPEDRHGPTPLRESTTGFGVQWYWQGVSD